MPQDTIKGNSGSSTSPPFLQFTDGGIRVNFAGFHAQAGLGGILGGTGTGGGLHASAGTPWGASAAAGLGGALDGNNGTAKGGLYASARSGFGPSAAAQLSGSTGPAQDTYPNENGGQKPPSSASTTGSFESSSRGRSNIQIISRKTSAPQLQVIHVKQSKPVAASVTTNISGSVEAEPALASAVSPVGKVKTITKIKTVEPAPPVPLLSSQNNEVVPVGNSQEVTVVYPKRAFRKRLWWPRKQIVYSSTVETEDPSTADTQQIARRQAQGAGHSSIVVKTNSQPAQTTNENHGLFDDIFNIPISTLNAVNRLLNNNVG
ncbi:uncharacterized protein LOC116430162 isoform X2 [Nomia melanderi]|nr:uncharacterized protein LOC116430162 isoform X2 [Nomia melanderi]